jgi:hypothetical protein
VIPLAGGRLIFTVEETTGARLRPSDRDDELKIEGVPVTEAGVPLYHGMVFSLAHRSFVYFEREPGARDRQRPYLQPPGATMRRGRTLAPRGETISDVGTVDEFFVFDDSLDEGRAFDSSASDESPPKA